jgi:hypothetical protein
MEQNKEVWYLKWKTFYNRLEDQERIELTKFLNDKLNKNELTWKDIESIDAIQRAAKGNLKKKK